MVVMTGEREIEGGSSEVQGHGRRTKNKLLYQTVNNKFMASPSGNEKSNGYAGMFTSHTYLGLGPAPAPVTAM